MCSTSDRVRRNLPSLLLVALVISGASGGEWKTIPEEGIVLEEGKVLRSMGRGARVNIDDSIHRGMNPFPPIDTLQQRDNHEGPELFLEGIRSRAWHRAKEEVQGKTLGKGAVQHYLYEEAKDSAKRQKARERKGEKRRSLLERGLRKLF